MGQFPLSDLPYNTHRILVRDLGRAYRLPREPMLISGHRVVGCPAARKYNVQSKQ